MFRGSPEIPKFRSPLTTPDKTLSGSLVSEFRNREQKGKHNSRVDMHSCSAKSRQCFFLECLRRVKPNSVVDVACGEGRLLEALTTCSDAIPIERLWGIDGRLDCATTAAQRLNLAAQSQQRGLGRWRRLETNILCRILPLVDF